MRAIAILLTGKEDRLRTMGGRGREVVVVGKDRAQEEN